jgi:hypothetical protein
VTSETAPEARGRFFLFRSFRILLLTAMAAGLLWTQEAVSAAPANGAWTPTASNREALRLIAAKIERDGFDVAALQVEFARIAAGLDKDRMKPLAASGVCPVCGSPPSPGWSSPTRRMAVDI